MTDLQKTASALVEDLNQLDEAHQFLEVALDDTQKRYPDDRLQMSPNLPFAAWAYIRFKKDKANFIQFVAEALDRDPARRSQLWSFEPTPDRNNPEPDAERLLGRIDVAVHFLAKELNMK